MILQHFFLICGNKFRKLILLFSKGCHIWKWPNFPTPTRTVRSVSNPTLDLFHLNFTPSKCGDYQTLLFQIYLSCGFRCRFTPPLPNPPAAITAPSILPPIHTTPLVPSVLPCPPPTELFLICGRFVRLLVTNFQ